MGTFDWVGRPKPTGQIWLVDWKVGDLSSLMRRRRLNLQNAAYQYAIFRILRSSLLVPLPSRSRTSRQQSRSSIKMVP